MSSFHMKFRFRMKVKKKEITSFISSSYFITHASAIFPTSKQICVIGAEFDDQLAVNRKSICVLQGSLIVNSASNVVIAF